MRKNLRTTDFFPAGSDPGLVLYATGFFMRVYDMPATVENEINALKSIQRTYNPDVLFPRMDLDEFKLLFSQQSNPINEEKKYAPEELIKVPTREEIVASHSVTVLQRAIGDASLKARYVGAFLPSPYSLTSSIIGLQYASKLLLRDRAYINPLIARAGDALIEYGCILSDLVDVVVILAPSECTMSKRLFDASAQAPLQRLVEVVARGGEEVTFFHLCTRRNEHLLTTDTLAPLAKLGLTGLNIPNVLENAAVTRELNLVVLGGIDPISVQQSPWQDVLQTSRTLLEKAKDLRFILGTDCDLTKIPRIEAEGTLLTKLSELKKLVREFSHHTN